MIRMNDIYYKMNYSLEEQCFEPENIEYVKGVIDKQLKKYLILKIAQLGNYGVLKSPHKDEVSVNDLVGVLGAMIPEDKHFDTLRHLSHYVLNIAGVIQGRSITWWSEKDPNYIDCLEATFDENGFWDSVITHKEASYVDTFDSIYNIFTNDFMKKQNKKIISISEV